MILYLFVSSSAELLCNSLSPCFLFLVRRSSLCPSHSSPPLMVLTLSVRCCGTGVFQLPPSGDPCSFSRDGPERLPSPLSSAPGSPDPTASRDPAPTVQRSGSHSPEIQTPRVWGSSSHESGDPDALEVWRSAAIWRQPGALRGSDQAAGAGLIGFFPASPAGGSLGSWRRVTPALAAGTYTKISARARRSPALGKEGFLEHYILGFAKGTSPMSYDKADKWLTQIQCRAERA